MRYGKIALLVAVCTALTTVLSPVAALAEYDQPYVSIGADLTGREEAEILELLKVPAEKINEDTAVYVTEEDTFRYLEGMSLDEADRAGSLTSCKVVRRKRGRGLKVRTSNVLDVTDDIYRNALVTCGMEDANVVVASASPVSGRAALVVTMAAWAKMNGLALDTEIIQTAVRELEISDTIARETGDAEKTAELVAAVKDIVTGSRLRGEKQIRPVIKEVSAELGFVIPAAHVELLADYFEEV